MCKCEICNTNCEEIYKGKISNLLKLYNCLSIKVIPSGRLFTFVVNCKNIKIVCYDMCYKQDYQKLVTRLK